MPKKMQYEYEKKYSLGQLLDAHQAAEIVSENSGKEISINNISGVLLRHGVQPAGKVKGNNQYLYDEVRRVKVRATAGRPRVGARPLSDAERMKRSRSGKSKRNSAHGRKRST